mmetsp:Transcript_18482/g.57348  ORF Transcript_18482/g.57348 Transcript_18482/m.57348 type:complete len:225 (-) Transcript_18482:409-1083(-)
MPRRADAYLCFCGGGVDVALCVSGVESAGVAPWASPPTSLASRAALRRARSAVSSASTYLSTSSSTASGCPSLRTMSPLHRCSKPYLIAMARDCVDLPEPRPPTTRTMRGRGRRDRVVKMLASSVVAGITPGELGSIASVATPVCCWGGGVAMRSPLTSLAWYCGDCCCECCGDMLGSCDCDGPRELKGAVIGMMPARWCAEGIEPTRPTCTVGSGGAALGLKK